MKRLFAFFLAILVLCFSADSQTKRRSALPGGKNANISTENIRSAVVADERLAVLRTEPSFYAETIQRMRSGRILTVTGSKIVDGITFYKVVMPPRNYGWVQAEALIAKNRRADEERLARLIQSSKGFDQIERLALFLDYFPSSPLRPAFLLMLGDLAEENAVKLSTEAGRRLDRKEMTATGAPLHSFYLNYSGLDRFRKIGINFWVNPATRKFHYNGTAWQEILTKFPKSGEAEEAKKRLDLLKEKMARTEPVKQ